MLAVIDVNGSAELLPWDPAGAALMARVGRVLESAPPDEGAALAVAAADRYYKAGLERDGRINLPPNLAFHLGAADGAATRVVVAAGRLWIWSEARWTDGRRARFDEIDDALARAAPGDA